MAEDLYFYFVWFFLSRFDFSSVETDFKRTQSTHLSQRSSFSCYSTWNVLLDVFSMVPRILSSIFGWWAFKWRRWKIDISNNWNCKSCHCLCFDDFRNGKDTQREKKSHCLENVLSSINSSVNRRHRLHMGFWNFWNAAWRKKNNTNNNLIRDTDKVRQTEERSQIYLWRIYEQSQITSSCTIKNEPLRELFHMNS